MDRPIQLSQGKIDALTDAVDGVQELLGAGQNAAEWDASWGRLERALWDLQVTSLSPFNGQFGRMAQEVATQLGKQVRWDCTGLAVEVSPSVRDLVSGILLHTVRNALDHGIEHPFDRIAAGKSSEGNLRVRVHVEFGNLVIEISDDGRGPDAEKIMQRGLQLGLITQSQAEKMTPAERLDLVFRPGFSTKDRSTDLSGRGIGLDAVRSSAQEFGGMVTALLPPEGGFGVRVTLPMSIVCAEVLPLMVGSQLIWVQRQGPEPIEVRPTRHQINLAERLVISMGWKLSRKVPRVVRMNRPDGLPVYIAADDVGVPERRLFRSLDSSWRQNGPAWLKTWFRWSSPGSVLACRRRTVSAADLVQPQPGTLDRLGLWLDPELLYRLTSGD